MPFSASCYYRLCLWSRLHRIEVRTSVVRPAERWYNLGDTIGRSEWTVHSLTTDRIRMSITLGTGSDRCQEQWITPLLGRRPSRADGSEAADEESMTSGVRKVDGGLSCMQGNATL